jgi:hypothetical protein
LCMPQQRLRPATPDHASWPPQHACEQTHAGTHQLVIVCLRASSNTAPPTRVGSSRATTFICCATPSSDWRTHAPLRNDRVCVCLQHLLFCNTLVTGARMQPHEWVPRVRA